MSSRRSVRSMPGVDPASGPIPYVDIGAQWAAERDELLPIVERVLASGHYVGGDEVEALERELSETIGVPHVIALNSGTDALMLGMAVHGIGRDDEVITPPNSFVASTAAIVHIGAKPVFVDVGPDQNIDPGRIEAAITPKTKAIMPVHLTGRLCDMDAIGEIARRHGLLVVEDSAQAIGSTWRGVATGALGDVGCFSAHPLKNLNAIGDAGFFTTRDGDAARKAQLYRNHGLATRNDVEIFGLVSRMDTLKAAVLRYRLGRLDGIIRQRRANAATYREHLDRRHVWFPEERDHAVDSYHTFVIQVDQRDRLREHLTATGIGSGIHYPIPIHLQPAAAGLGYSAGDFPETERQAGRILTLPVNQSLGEAEIIRVAEAVNGFFAGVQV